MRGVVIFASSHAHLLTFEARRPGEQFLQLGEPARTAAVLGRARALAGDALWVYRGRVGRGSGLDGNLVFPAVAEVVLVTGQVPGLHQITDPELLFVERLKLVVQISRAVFPAGDPEHVQVGVLPPHRGLDDAVDPVEGVASGDHHLSPHRRAVHAGERDPQLLGLEAAVGLLIGHGTWLARADFVTAAVTFGRDGITGEPMASVDFQVALAARRAGALPCSSSEEQILALAASIATGIPVPLGDLVSGLDEDNAVRVAIAVLHAAGFGERSVLVTRGRPGRSGR